MIYFRGCTAREKETSIKDATEKLLDLAGIDYRVLDDEKCCGSVLMRTGFIKEAKKQIQKNTQLSALTPLKSEQTEQRFFLA